jgi:microcystin-dependent protein
MAEPYIGEIKVFASNFAPRGWAFCDGRLIPIVQNQALFAVLGTTYGGDGVATFALPDLRSRALIHLGQGPGLSSYVEGQMGGVESVALTQGQLPSHTHSMVGTTAAATAPNPGPTVAMAATPTGEPIYGSSTGPVNLSPRAVTAAGSDQPHENVQPSLAISYIIALTGVFPSRN